ncbi:unnamed protein product [Callosobruchus maculatus]|uniref:Uncharacterized protein n=1 Tax=Callosobruchus maculatus TaxID=64391 RepID=A0A653DLD0_CALMS|nr:unnamed protein product [Callosobruchus maculatus]
MDTLSDEDVIKDDLPNISKDVLKDDSMQMVLDSFVNKLFCFACVLFGGDDTWAKKGADDLIHIWEKIKTHEKSKVHMNNVFSLSMLVNNIIIVEQNMRVTTVEIFICRLFKECFTSCSRCFGSFETQRFNVEIILNTSCLLPLGPVSLGMFDWVSFTCWASTSLVARFTMQTLTEVVPISMPRLYLAILGVRYEMKCLCNMEEIMISTK